MITQHSVDLMKDCFKRIMVINIQNIYDGTFRTRKHMDLLNVLCVGFDAGINFVISSFISYFHHSDIQYIIISIPFHSTCIDCFFL